MPRSSPSIKSNGEKNPILPPIVSTWVIFLILLTVHAWIIFIGLNPATDFFSLTVFQRVSLLPHYYLAVIFFLSIASVELAQETLAVFKSFGKSIFIVFFS
jgi:hypothetical protein